MWNVDIDTIALVKYLSLNLSIEEITEQNVRKLILCDSAFTAASQGECRASLDYIRTHIRFVFSFGNSCLKKVAKTIIKYLH